MSFDSQLEFFKKSVILYYNFLISQTWTCFLLFTHSLYKNSNQRTLKHVHVYDSSVGWYKNLSLLIDM